MYANLCVQSLKRASDDDERHVPRKHRRSRSPPPVIRVSCSPVERSPATSLRYPLRFLLRSVFAEREYSRITFKSCPGDVVGTALRHQLRDAMSELCGDHAVELDGLMDVVPPPRECDSGSDALYLRSLHRQLVRFVRCVFISERTSQAAYNSASPLRTPAIEHLNPQLLESMDELYDMSRYDVDVVLSLLPHPA